MEMSDDEKMPHASGDGSHSEQSEQKQRRVVHKKPVRTAKDVKSNKECKFLSTEAEADSDASSDEADDLSDTNSLHGFVVDSDDSLGISGSDQEMEDGSMHRMLESKLDELSDSGIAASSVSDLARARPKGKSLHAFKLGLDTESKSNAAVHKSKMQQMREEVAKAKHVSRRARLVVGSDSEETREETIEREKARQIAAEMNNESDASMHQSARSDMIVELPPLASKTAHAKTDSKPRPNAKRKPSTKPSAKSSSNAALLSTAQHQFEKDQSKKKQAAKPRKSRAKPRPALVPLDANSLGFKISASPARKKHKIEAKPIGLESAAAAVVEGVSDSDSDREADPHEASGKFAAEGAHVRMGRALCELVHRGDCAPVMRDSKNEGKMVYNLSAITHKHYCTLKAQDGELKMAIMCHELAPFELKSTPIARTIEKKTNEMEARFKRAVQCDNKVRVDADRDRLLIPPCLLTTKVVAQKVLREMAKDSKLPHSFDVLRRNDIENMFAKVLSLELEEKQVGSARFDVQSARGVACTPLARR